MAALRYRMLFWSVLLIITSLACGFGLTTQSPDIEATVAAGVLGTQQVQNNLQATVAAAVVATQSASNAGGATIFPTPSPVAIEPATAPPSPATEAVRAVIMREVEGAVSQDLEMLKSLYAPDAVVIDHNGTPNDPGDNTIWQGWASIERRYSAFFSAGFSSASLVDLTVQVDGNQAQGIHQGVILDGTFYADNGVYLLEQRAGQWLIVQLEYGNKADEETRPTVFDRDDGLYVLELGSQHRYEEPWGWDRGDPCQAWQTGDFDDTKPNYRGFNVELLLTNNTEQKVPDEWPITFTTAKGQSVKACSYDYTDSGPRPGATSSVTFFTVVEVGDYVETITFTHKDQLIRLCLNGQGGAQRC